METVLAFYTARAAQEGGLGAENAEERELAPRILVGAGLPRYLGWAKRRAAASWVAASSVRPRRRSTSASAP